MRLAFMRATPEYAHIPVLVFTGAHLSPEEQSLVERHRALQKKRAERRTAFGPVSLPNRPSVSALAGRSVSHVSDSASQYQQIYASAYRILQLGTPRTC